MIGFFAGGAYDCDYCGLIVRVELTYARPYGVSLGAMPANWYAMNGKTYCSKMCVRAALL